MTVCLPNTSKFENKVRGHVTRAPQELGFGFLYFSCLVLFACFCQLRFINDFLEIHSNHSTLCIKGCQQAWTTGASGTHFQSATFCWVNLCTPSWGCGTMIEHLLRMWVALGSIPRNYIKIKVRELIYLRILCVFSIFTIFLDVLDS